MTVLRLTRGCICQYTSADANSIYLGEGREESKKFFSRLDKFYLRRLLACKISLRDSVLNLAALATPQAVLHACFLYAQYAFIFIFLIISLLLLS